MVRSHTSRVRLTGRADLEASLLKFFDKATLDEAHKIILGTSESFGFDEQGWLINLEKERTDELSLALKAMDAGRNFSSLQRKQVAAVIAFLNTLRPATEDAESIQLKVRSREFVPDAGMRALMDRFEEYSFDLDDGDHSFMDMDENWQGVTKTPDQVTEEYIASVAGDLKRIEGIHDGSVTKPVLSDEEKREIFERKIYAGAEHIHPDDPLANDYDPRKLLEGAMETSETILNYANRKDVDIMRFHNSHPQAVNFIRISREMNYLLSRDGEERQASDPAVFAGSYWVNLAGSMDLTVDPKFLEAARAALRSRQISSVGH